ncbi:MAG TPA: DUF3105 domain-containing protein [Actinomycetota bacterium]|nr:DUF3105 domain-containing protein [Actinomycetota bacterium]
MPNKPTKAQRREAAKAARFESERKAKKERRKRFMLGGFIGAAIIGLIVAIILASGSSNKISVVGLNKDASAAGCTNLITNADQGRSHIQSPQTFNYNSNPPTSGSHYAIAGTAPTPTGVHFNQIQDEIQVHNLEHGHIGIQYNNIPDGVKSALEQFTNARDTYVFMAPRPQLAQVGVQLAFTRWDQKITCVSATDSAAVVKLATTFYNDFHGDGPEGAIPGTPITSSGQ